MYMKKVENSDKYRSAHQYYWQYKGAEGRYYLFSQNQLDVAQRRAEKNLEDLQPMHEPATFVSGLSVGFLISGIACMAIVFVQHLCG